MNGGGGAASFGGGGGGGGFDDLCFKRLLNDFDHFPREPGGERVDDEYMQEDDESNTNELLRRVSLYLRKIHTCFLRFQRACNCLSGRTRGKNMPGQAMIGLPDGHHPGRLFPGDLRRRIPA